MTAKDLIAKVTDLRPPAPSVVKLLTLLNRPEADSHAVVRVVAQDSVLSAKVLSLCNSAWFGSRTQIASISDALFLLGYAQIHRIVMAVSFGSMMNPSLHGYAIDERELWEHSLLTALLAREILEVAPEFSGDPAIAFTAALLHDIGKLALNSALDPGTQAEVLNLISLRSLSRLEAERVVIGCDHAEVGAQLLARWNIPENIVEAVANHHAPPLVPAPALSSVVHLANVIAHAAGSAPGWESFAVPIMEAVPDALGISPAAMERLVITAFDLGQTEPELSATHGARA